MSCSASTSADIAGTVGDILADLGVVVIPLARKHYLRAARTVGFVMRLFGRDRMQRRFDRTRSSYRTPSRQRSAQSMESPF